MVLIKQKYLTTRQIKYHLRVSSQVDKDFRFNKIKNTYTSVFLKSFDLFVNNVYSFVVENITDFFFIGACNEAMRISEFFSLFNVSIETNKFTSESSP